MKQSAAALVLVLCLAGCQEEDHPVNSNPRTDVERIVAELNERYNDVPPIVRLGNGLCQSFEEHGSHIAAVRRGDYSAASRHRANVLQCFSEHYSQQGAAAFDVATGGPPSAMDAQSAGEAAGATIGYHIGAGIAAAGFARAMLNRPFICEYALGTDSCTFEDLDAASRTTQLTNMASFKRSFGLP